MSDFKISLTDQNDAVFFTVNKAKHKIPSKLYPLSQKSKLKVFWTDNTADFINQPLFNLLDTANFKMGFCYSNAQAIVEAAKYLNIDVTYYSGWLFTGDIYPVHHAWVIMQLENDNHAVLDAIRIKPMFAVYASGKIDFDHPDYRNQIAREVRNFEKGKTNSELMILGQVPQGFLYVGSPDTALNAKTLYNKTIQQFPNHPSYKAKGQNAHGRSLLQAEFAKLDSSIKSVNKDLL